MSLALKWGDEISRPEDSSGFIYFDAVTSFNTNYKGQVTKHPVDGGGNITDHFIRENTTFNISAVISGVDISAIPNTIMAWNDGATTDNGRKPSNAQPQVVSVSITQESEGLLQYIPDSIGQFLTPGQPTIVLDQQIRTDLTIEVFVKSTIASLLSGVKFDNKTNKLVSDMKLVELYEFDGSNIRDITSDLVLVDFKVREDPNTGDALFLDITLEQVTFATLKSAVLPEDVVEEMKKKSQPATKKGNADSTPEDVGATHGPVQPPVDLDPAREASSTAAGA